MVTVVENGLGTIVEMLSLTAAARDAMVAHAVRGLPHEACGLFAGPAGGTMVDSFHPMTNVAASSEIYQLDPAEMMKVEATADQAGAQLMGVMHSHTHTTAYPSPTDIRDAQAFDPFGAWHFIIVSLKDATPVLRSYRISDGVVTEETLHIEG